MNALKTKMTQRPHTVADCVRYARSPGYVRSFAGWKAAARDLYAAVPLWVKFLDVAVVVVVIAVLKFTGVV